jgi:hypothetical protein
MHERIQFNCKGVCVESRLTVQWRGRLGKLKCFE